MPRNKGKKKKGKVVKPNMEEAVKSKFADAFNQKLGTLNMKVPESGNQTAATDSNSALDASQYTYYSESVNQSTLQDGGEEQKGANNDFADVKNIKADIEALDIEESKAPRSHQKNLKSARVVAKTVPLGGDQQKTGKAKTPKSARQQPVTQEKQETSLPKDKLAEEDSQTQEDSHIQSLEESKGEVPEVIKEEPALEQKEDQQQPTQKEVEVEVTNTEDKAEKKSVDTPKAAEVAIPAEEKEGEVDIDFVNDFDAAFGSDNDVPILNLAKGPSKEIKSDKAESAPEVVPAPHVKEDKQEVSPSEEVENVAEELILETPSKPDQQHQAQKPESKKQAETTPIEKPQEKPESRPASQEVKQPESPPKQSSEKASMLLGPQLGSSDAIQKTPEPLQQTSARSFQITPIQTEGASESESPLQAKKASATVPQESVPVFKMEESAAPVRSMETKPSPLTEELKKESKQESKQESIGETPKVEADSKELDLQTAASENKAEQVEKAAAGERLETKQNETELEEKKGEEEDSEEEEEQAGSGGNGKLLVLGAMAVAAGAYFYAKKNNINIEGEARRHFENASVHLTNASVHLAKLFKRQ